MHILSEHAVCGRMNAKITVALGDSLIMRTWSTWSAPLVMALLAVAVGPLITGSRCDAHAALVSALRGLNFDNTAVRTLAVDPQLGGPVRQRLPLAIRSDLAAYLSGNEQLPGAEPFAAAYCGHQFGRFAGQLGDGAVLRSSIRELLASEAMHALRLPTTRAAALEPSRNLPAGNNGQLREERCAVLARAGMTEEVLAPLFEYALQRHYPHLCSLPSRTQRVAAFVARRTAQLVAGWQTVGFVHGVLNTDNMAITGDTIDYGPFGFVDQFDPDYSPNDSDAAGRYSYRQQPAGEADDALLESLLGVMQRTGADFTNTFRALSRIGWEASEAASYRAPQDFDAVLEYCLAQCASTEAMLKRARPIFHPKALARLAAIAQTEPERLAQFGLDASVVARETQRAARREALARVTPRDKRLSDAEAWRAWLHARVQRLLAKPYDDQGHALVERYASLPPDWSHDLVLT
ncbi:hypothetical protein EMIHUDRAFT_454271 [Emiliania huxleyi CCMP1516]|uniref:Selenoprotein O n=2 Tax=Emiliania huxleyi TaxID=2903 RepID=A0A0D3KXA7_EMIH1|nr:hypothetical protein EMIHUDRAFT_454271 [Emiliania huxleyi CCMP1516]EOD40392.1 hypothetical protein EMIHUDRAFT_454271 [Emiliania huxleyi CCMP1516]|eukprot:XP_005792821.1 hypothetical protein EMIHUDRAFT_454271 [Emiliania huxleyi CCMP1516]